MNVAVTLPVPAARERPIRILIVEDNPADARYLEEILREVVDSSFVSRSAEDLASARDALALEAFDVILLDLGLPDGDGLKNIISLRVAAPHTPVVVLTGLHDEALALQALKIGAQDYLVKGKSDATAVARAIRYAFERQRLEEERLARTQAELAAKQAAFLAEASRVLAMSLDLDVTLQSLASVMVPTLADYCCIDLMSGGELRRVAVDAVGDEQRALLHATKQFPPALPSHPARRAIETGTTIFHDCRTPTAREAFIACPEHGELAVALNPQFAACVPIRSRDGVLGAITLIRTEGSPEFTEGDRGLAEDIAARAALSIEHARSLQAAHEAAAARQEMVAVVSHDLRNPLSVIGLMIRRLRGMPAVVAAAGVEPLERAERALARTNHLIDDLLDLARIDAGGLELKRATIDAATLVEEAVDHHRPLAESAKLTIRAAIDGTCALECDHRRVAQVFANLIGNSIKFTPEGGTITVGFARQGDRVLFTVTDTGPGIPAQHVERLFERFFRVPGERKPGSGLGLAIAKGIVVAHGGTIFATSRVGEGTTITFALPGCS